MIKCYLAHSSSDKKSYVEIVARQLGRMQCIYDEFVFEEGKKNLDEILKYLGQSDLFVIFLSDSALDSEWVKRELNSAVILLNEQKLKQLFPIIIDRNITYKDTRIPPWMRDEYNLKLISRPTVAVRRIKQTMREISWQYHPRLKEKEAIFVGRNDQIRSFEERMDNIDLMTPTCVVASGLRSIGRRSLIKNCLVKATVKEETYRPPIIFMTRSESIEDFIYRIYDLGFSDTIDLTNLIRTEMDRKIEIATTIVKDLQHAREILFIVDSGCIFTHERVIASWFLKILQNIQFNQQLTIGVASIFRALPLHNNLEYLFFMDVPELNRMERRGLLKRYSEFEMLTLSNEDFHNFSKFLNGYPEQVFYLVDLIKDQGLSTIRNSMHLLIEFNSERVNQILQKYESNESAKSLLYLLANFDFISFEFLFDIIGDDGNNENIISEFIASSICDLIGSNKEYIRLNDVVRDYLTRIKVDIPDQFKEKLIIHHKHFVETYKTEEKDVSDYLHSIKQMLLSKEVYDDRYLIPSHFLKTIREVYDHRKQYQDVIMLADRILTNENYFDENIKRDIRYYLCLALARQRNKRFLTEVQKIKGSEHNFLMGFYYRHLGRSKEAIERYEAALIESPNFSRAKREIVLVYGYLSEYEKVYDMAKDNYESNRNNPFHIQAYFDCLIRMPDFDGRRDILKELIQNLDRVDTDVAKEMTIRSKAQYAGFVDNDKKVSLDLLDEAVSVSSNSFYPKSAKFDICEKFRDIEGMKSALDDLEKSIDKDSYHYMGVLKKKCIYKAYTEGSDSAIKFLQSRLINYPTRTKDELIQKIIRIGELTS